LMYSSLLGNRKMTEMLIHARANVNQINAVGITALHNAASGNHFEIVLLLLRNGANRFIKSIDGNIPLDYASDDNMRHFLRGKKTSKSHPYHIDFLDKTTCPQLGEARIGMSMCPGRVWEAWYRDFNEDLKVILEDKVQVICSVITNTELKIMKLHQFKQKFQSAGLETIQYSIHDKWLPNSIDNFLSFVNTILFYIHKEKTILVHCNGGKGRTGLIVVSCLFFLGVPIDEGMNMIRTLRSGMLRNPAQEVFLHALSSRLREDPEKSLLLMKTSVSPLLPDSHTHLSESSSSNGAINDDSGQDVDKTVSSTEHS